MCGITGLFYPDSADSAEEGLLRKMTDCLVHRGPDEAGLYVEGPVGLGHRRLRIIDLEGGKQPIFNEDNSIVIVFNGEIYNFRALRETLEQKGHRFRTRTDTETIVHAYEEYGADCVKHLRGMFAFAIWDTRKRELFLARDRLGIKPLYYHWDGKTFVFASELKSILEVPGVQRQVDPEAIDDYLTYLYIPAPKTIFRQMYKLEAGHSLTVSAAGLRDREYWDLRFEPEDLVSEADCEAALMDKLRESVSVRLISEVPLGAFLSGGVDSSAVVGLMSGLLDTPVKTATIGFEESGYNEAPQARAVAELFKTDAFEKTVVADAANILDTLIWHYDEPFADSSMVPTYYVSQVARERVTVCLSGDGGDENFAGYRRYRYDVLENRLRSFLPGGLRVPLFGALGRVYPKADWLPQVFRAKTLLSNLARSPERGYFHSMSVFHQDMKDRLYRDAFKRELGDYEAFSVMERHFKRTEGWDPLSRIQYVDIKTYLVDDILTKVDRASMAHALEVRVPLLDHEFMEFAATIPASLKLRNGEGKYILKKALGNLLPNDILYRRKMGFSMPLAQWFRNGLKKPFEDRVLAPNSFLRDWMDTDLIQHWWNEHQRHLRDYSSHLWSLVVLESWAQRFLTR